MHQDYKDISDRISEKPSWFDEYAVPRYCEFDPYKVANIYANEAALVLIACQCCGTEFKVAFTERDLEHVLWDHKKKKKIKSISDLIEEDNLHYGDPPNVDCCPSGASTNSVPVRVLEYWYKPIVRGKGLAANGRTVSDPSAMVFRRDQRFEKRLSARWERS